MMFRQRTLPASGNVGAKKIAEEFNKSARLSRGTELVTTKGVLRSLPFAHPREGPQAEVRRSFHYLLEAQCGLASPLCSILKLSYKVRRCKDIDELEWSFDSVADRVASGLMLPDEPGLRSMACVVGCLLAAVALASPLRASVVGV